MEKSDDWMFTPQLAKTKKQHYVPRFYLDGFADGTQVALFNRDTGKAKRQTPDRTAYVPNLYTFEDNEGRRRYDFEVMFNKYETRAAPIILKLAAQGRINSAEREDLAAFITFAALRTPTAIEEARAVYGALYKADAKQRLSDYTQVLTYLRSHNSDGMDETTMQAEATRISKILRDGHYDVEVSREFALGKSLRNFETVATALLNRDWVVVTAPEHSPGFLTTDHPVVLTTLSSALRAAPLGYASPHAQVLFPLTHKAALIMSGDQARIGRASLSPEKLSRFNQTMAVNCQRYLFGRDPDHLQRVADEVSITGKPWKSKYTVGVKPSADERSTDLFVLRTGDTLPP